MFIAIRSLIALFVALSILLIGHGLQLTLAPLYAEELGWSNNRIGFIGSVYFLGFVIGCLTIPKLVASVGHIRVFATLTALATCALLMLGLSDNYAIWLLSRTITGWSIAGLYMVIESWLNERSSNENRGTILSIYSTITLVAIAGGQTLFSVGLSTQELIMLGALIIAASAVPVGLSPANNPAPIPSVKFKLKAVYQSSNVAVIGALVGGFATAGFWALGPIVANALQIEHIGLFMAVTIVGGAVFQVPVGRLSDYFDRRLVIAALALGGTAVSGLALVIAGHSNIMTLICMFLFGGTTFPLYSLCLAHANDQSDMPLIEIGSVILIMHSVGAVIGPIVIATMLSFNSMALFWVSLMVLAIFATWTLIRIRLHPVARPHFEPYQEVPRTTTEILEVSQDDEIDPPVNDR